MAVRGRPRLESSLALDRPSLFDDDPFRPLPTRFPEPNFGLAQQEPKGLWPKRTNSIHAKKEKKSKTFTLRVQSR